MGTGRYSGVAGRGGQKIEQKIEFKSMRSDLTKYLRKFPPPLATGIKKATIYPHYWMQASKCRMGYMAYGNRYKHNIMFVAGTPKSGTTWVENMLDCFPGFSKLLIPEASLRRGPEAHNLPSDTFSRMRHMLVISKMHLHWTKYNTDLLKDSGVPYIVQYRDFRDMYVSDYFYVKNTPWHFFYPTIINMTLEEYIHWCIEFHLPDYCIRVDSWCDHRDVNSSFVIRYEDLIANALKCMKGIQKLYELPATDEELANIVEKNSFASVAKGRTPGVENKQSHLRKGVAGDWKNHYTAQHKEAIKQIAGDWLIRHGYESDSNW
jgi:hypothetical protein